MSLISPRTVVPSVLTITALLSLSMLGLGGKALRSDPQASSQEKADASKTLTGDAALGDWTTDAPGVRRKITVADLPAPYATKSTDNGAHMVPRPDGAWPKVPAGFKVEEYLSGLENPRYVTVAPNGDIFVVESEPGRVKVLRAADGAEKPASAQVFAEGLAQLSASPFIPPVPILSTSMSPTPIPWSASLIVKGISKHAVLRNLSSPRFRRRASPRRRSLDPRYQVLSGRQEDVCLRGIAHQ